MDRVCVEMEQDAKERGNDFRVFEIRNIRTGLNGVLEAPDLLSSDEIGVMLSAGRKRIDALRCNPESAGTHTPYVGKDFLRRK